MLKQRMDCTAQVADYKAARCLPALQQAREREILNRVSERFPSEYRQQGKVIFTTLMTLSRHQKQKLMKISPTLQTLLEPIRPLPKNAPKMIGLLGSHGSFSHLVVCARFLDSDILFYSDVCDLVLAVQSGEVSFGVLPLEHSDVHLVRRIRNFFRKHGLYVNQVWELKQAGCPDCRDTVNPDETNQVRAVPQGGFLCRHEDNTAFYCNSMPAKCGANSRKSPDAVRSKEVATFSGLEAFCKNTQNSREPGTEFWVISKFLYTHPQMDTVSAALSLPNTVDALHSLFTQFAVDRVHLKKIELNSVGVEQNEALFILDVTGNLSSPSTLRWIQVLSQQSKFFALLGSYRSGDFITESGGF